MNQTQAKQSTDDSEATFRIILGVALALVALGVLLAVGVSVYLLRSISRPLDKATGIANDIAEGRLENRVVVDSGGSSDVFWKRWKKWIDNSPARFAESRPRRSQ